jgi:sugar lactone lactonase YvrE
MDRRGRKGMTSRTAVIADYSCEVGEGVLWHPEEKRVYWTDIPNGHLYRYDPGTDAHEQVYDGDTVGAFTFQKDGSLLLFGAEGRVDIWRNGELKPVVDRLPEESGMRFNDVIADPAGRVFCGTMDTDDFSKGRLYRLDTDGSITTVLDPVKLPNGMGFTPDTTGFYLTESDTNEIHRFDYDIETGALSDQQTFSSLPDTEGMYDGMTVDDEGRVWSALWGGGAIVRHGSDGEVERRVSVPAENVTSLTFGGEDLRDMYVSSATFEADPAEEYAGALFRIESNVQGTREFVSDIRP